MQQSTEWLAHNLDGLLSFAPSPIRLQRAFDDWQSHVHAAAEDTFKLLGMVDLSADPDEPFQRIPGGLRAGRNGLVDYLKSAQATGFTHAALNAKVSRQPYVEILEELAEYVLSHFPSHECLSMSDNRR